MKLTDEMVEEQIKDVRGKVFTIYVYISIIAIIFYTLIFVWFELYIGALFQIAFLLPFSLSIPWYKKGIKTPSILLAIGSSLIIVLLQTFYVFSNQAGFHLQYLALMIIIFLVSDMRQVSQRRISLMLALITSVSFYLCESYADSSFSSVLVYINYGFLHNVSLTITLVAMIIILFAYSSELSKKERALSYMAQNDALTGIFNRGYFTKSGEQLFVTYQTTPSSLSVILFDIDNFKHINDKFGHHAGDSILISLCETVESLLDKKYIFSRYGGEEFAILLPETAKNDAFLIAETIRTTIEASTATYNRLPIQFTISLGVSALRSTYTSFDELMQDVDRQLYISKNQGKNRTTMS